MKIKKLCLLRLSALGDVCHAVAMVQRIQRHAPQIAITWIIGKIEYELLKGLPGVRFLIFDKSQGKHAYSQLKQQLANQHFDALLLMQVALRANWAARLVKAKVKIGFDWSRSKELHWLFANKRVKKQQHAHVVDGFMAFADALGIPSEPNVQWQMPVTAAAQSWADERCQHWGSFVVISPAASKVERNWLPERYAAIADVMHAKGYAVVLCGGPSHSEQILAEQIVTHTAHVSANLVGRTSLKQMLAVLSRASLLIAPDTGPAHMATSVGTDVVGLYAHSNPLRTGPYQNQDLVVSVYADCIQQQYGKAWSQLEWGVRAKGNDLMAQISVPMVIAKIEQWLATQAPT